jgi:hypothetical protein
MSYDFPTNPVDDQEYTPPVGGQTYIYKSPRWLVKGIPPAGGGSGGGMEEAPTDGKQYVRQSAAWTSIVIPSTDWASISGKPATFPPTLPIPSSGVTGLDAAQTAQDTAILGKEPTITAGTTAQYRRGDKTWQTLDKAAVGLANVDNTSDANKPISTAVSAALNLKEDKANKGAANGYASLDATSKVPAAQLPSYVDDVLEYANFAAFPGTGAAGVIYVALDTNKTYRWSGTAYIEISASPGSTDAVPEGSTNLYYTNARAAAAAPVQSVNTRTGAIILTKADVGLANVDNTGDLNKPISTATQAALNGKENIVISGTTAQYWRGDKTWQDFPASEPPIVPGTTSHYWRGDKTWATLDKTAVGLAAVDNTSDINKLVSTPTQNALDGKINKAGDTMTGDLTVNGVIKGSTGSFQSLAVDVLLCTTGAGNVYLRPNGYGSTAGQFTVTSSGLAITGGPVVLPADPVTDLQAATKQYVDTRAGAGLLDAPSDGKSYVRKNGAWVDVSTITAFQMDANGDAIVKFAANIVVRIKSTGLILTKDDIEVFSVSV